MVNNINTINNYNKYNATINFINQNTLKSPEIPKDTFIQNNNSNLISYQLDKIIEKLQKLGIYNKELLYKIIYNLPPYKQRAFLAQFESLVDILSSNDIEKKLHPKVVKAINESVVYYHNFKEVREFKDLKDFAIKLLIDLINSLSDFNTINQGYKGTCAQTAVERSIAERDPEQYVKIIKDLITQGEYIAPDGSKIPLNSGGIRKTKDEQNDPRYLTTRILSPSLMEFYHDKNIFQDDYDEDNDVEINNGIKGSNADKTASAIYNTQYEFVNIENYNSDSKIFILANLLRNSRYPIFIYVNYSPNPIESANHVLELKNITQNSITVSNPWGQIETYTNEIKHIYNSKYPKGYQTPIRNYEDFIRRIGFIAAPRELILLTLNSDPFLSRFIPVFKFY
jgi:hypothetical protein